MPGSKGVALPNHLLDVVRADELARLESERVRLDAQVKELRPRVQALTARLASAEEAWERAGGHTLADAEALTLLKEETPKLCTQLADLEQQLAGVEGQIRMIHEGDARGRAMALMQEKWPPTCQALAGPVRALLAGIQAQRATYDLLYTERATGNIEQDTYLAGDDYLLTQLEHWLVAVERAGYLKK